MADVFISYKSDRRSAAKYLADILAAHGFSVWFDYALVPGQNFGRHIENELRSAKAVVVLWCSMSVKSEWVHNEAALAKRLKRLVPTRIEACELPLEFLRDDFIDLTDWDGDPGSRLLDRLVDSVEGHVGRDAQIGRRELIQLHNSWSTFGSPSLAEFALESPTNLPEQGFSLPTSAAPPEASESPIQQPTSVSLPEPPRWAGAVDLAATPFQPPAQLDQRYPKAGMFDVMTAHISDEHRVAAAVPDQFVETEATVKTGWLALLSDGIEPRIQTRMALKLRPSDDASRLLAQAEATGYPFACFLSGLDSYAIGASDDENLQAVAAWCRGADERSGLCYLMLATACRFALHPQLNALYPEFMKRARLARVHRFLPLDEMFHLHPSEPLPAGLFESLLAGLDPFINEDQQTDSFLLAMALTLLGEDERAWGQLEDAAHAGHDPSLLLMLLAMVRYGDQTSLMPEFMSASLKRLDDGVFAAATAGSMIARYLVIEKTVHETDTHTTLKAVAERILKEGSADRLLQAVNSILRVQCDIAHQDREVFGTALRFWTTLIRDSLGETGDTELLLYAASTTNFIGLLKGEEAGREGLQVLSEAASGSSKVALFNLFEACIDQKLDDPKVAVDLPSLQGRASEGSLPAHLALTTAYARSLGVPRDDAAALAHMMELASGETREGVIATAATAAALFIGYLRDRGEVDLSETETSELTSAIREIGHRLLAEENCEQLLLALLTVAPENADLRWLHWLRRAAEHHTSARLAVALFALAESVDPQLRKLAMGQLGRQVVGELQDDPSARQRQLVNELAALAQRRNPLAMYLFGIANAGGIGVPRDPATAIAAVDDAFENGLQPFSDLVRLLVRCNNAESQQELVRQAMDMTAGLVETAGRTELAIAVGLAPLEQTTDPAYAVDQALVTYWLQAAAERGNAAAQKTLNRRMAANDTMNATKVDAPPGRAAGPWGNPSSS